MSWPLSAISFRHLDVILQSKTCKVEWVSLNYHWSIRRSNGVVFMDGKYLLFPFGFICNGVHDAHHQNLPIDGKGTSHHAQSKNRYLINIELSVSQDIFTLVIHAPYGLHPSHLESPRPIEGSMCWPNSWISERDRRGKEVGQTLGVVFRATLNPGISKCAGLVVRDILISKPQWECDVWGFFPAREIFVSRLRLGLLRESALT